MRTPDNVLVMGGGPAGSVIATLLAQEGMRVRLIESQRFPRYHIGESLTPSTREVLRLVGVADTLDSGGFQIKRGGVFHWGGDRWTIDWTTLFGDTMRTWQVDRAEFDHLLLRNARDKGVRVREGVTGKSVSFAEDGRPVAVDCVGDDGSSFTAKDFDVLVDATGRAGLITTRHLRNRRQHQFFRNVAIWGYWKDARLLPGSPEGAVNVVDSPKGWYWVIPLTGGRTSIGLVTHKDTFAAERRTHESTDTLYRALVDESAEVSELVAGAEQVSAARVETDYSYVADEFSGPGYLVVGDAACFLDPLLSTGVHLALYSALVGAAALASTHRGEIDEVEGRRFFEFAYRRAYTRMLALVSSMYERYQGKSDFFDTADRLARATAAPGGPERDSASFGEIIAGLTDWREAGDSSLRVLTARLEEEARRVQREAAASGDGHSDLSALRDTPVTDGALMGLRVVTEPRLGLKRVG